MIRSDEFFSSLFIFIKVFTFSLFFSVNYMLRKKRGVELWKEKSFHLV